MCNTSHEMHHTVKHINVTPHYPQVTHSLQQWIKSHLNSFVEKVNYIVNFGDIYYRRDQPVSQVNRKQWSVMFNGSTQFSKQNLKNREITNLPQILCTPQFCFPNFICLSHKTHTFFCIFSFRNEREREFPPPQSITQHQQPE